MTQFSETKLLKSQKASYGSRTWKKKRKHSLRLNFRLVYGGRKLKFDVRCQAKKEDLYDEFLKRCAAKGLSQIEQTDSQV